MSGFLSRPVICFVPCDSPSGSTGSSSTKFFGSASQRSICSVVIGPSPGTPEVSAFAETLERVCVETVESGKMTKDLALLIGPDQEYQTTQQFLDSIDENLKAAMAAG